MYSVETVRTRIKELILKHEPTKIESLDVLMKQFRGKEDNLNEYLCEKYNEKYTEIKRVNLKKKYAIGHKIGTGTYSIVRECKLRREYIDSMMNNNEKNENNDSESENENENKNENESKEHHRNVSSLGSGMSMSSVGSISNLVSGQCGQCGQCGQQPRVFAMKIINKETLEKDDLKMLESEVSFLRLLTGHPNIVELYDVFESRSKFCIILDYLSGGQLFDRMIDAGYFNEKFACELFSQLCNSLKYIHSFNIIHRDIKPQNLIFENEFENSHLKLIDFGFAVRKNDNSKLTEVCGTPNYMAPEMLNEQEYDEKVDMWAAGVILHTMLVGTLPYLVTFDSKNNLKEIKNQFDINSKDWRYISDDAKDLVCGLLRKDSKERYSAQEALCHPWMNRASNVNNKRMSNDNLDKLKTMRCAERLQKGVRCILGVCRLIEVLTEKSLKYNHNNNYDSNENQNENNNENKNDSINSDNNIMINNINKNEARALTAIMGTVSKRNSEIELRAKLAANIFNRYDSGSRANSRTNSRVNSRENSVE